MGLATLNPPVPASPIRGTADHPLTRTVAESSWMLAVLPCNATTRTSTLWITVPLPAETEGQTSLKGSVVILS
jgi:hypothetical protein